MVTEVYGHILDEDRKKNAQLIKLINRQLFSFFIIVSLWYNRDIRIEILRCEIWN